jgi:hypothetical protein
VDIKKISLWKARRAGREAQQRLSKKYKVAEGDNLVGIWPVMHNSIYLLHKLPKSSILVNICIAEQKTFSVEKEIDQSGHF